MPIPANIQESIVRQLVSNMRAGAYHPAGWGIVAEQLLRNAGHVDSVYPPHAPTVRSMVARARELA